MSMTRLPATSNILKNQTGWLFLQYSDADLVAAAKTGDTAAFDQLILRHQERVYAIAYHMIGNADDAADIQQEVFVRAWTKLGGFRGEAAFATWLSRIVVNACIAHKRRPRSAGTLEDLPEPACPDLPNGSERMVDGVVVRQVLDQIPAKHRTLLVLREVQGMSVGEVAQVTGSSVEAVRKQLWRVRKLFGKLLRQHLMEDER